MKIKVTERPPLAPEHGVEVGQFYEARDGEESDNKGRSKFIGSVWIDGKVEPVRLLAHEFEHVEVELDCPVCAGAGGLDAETRCGNCAGTGRLS